MKNYLVSLLFFFYAIITYAQWQPDVRLTNSTGISYTSDNNVWCVAASGSVVHVVWYDDRDGNYEIYYKRSTDAGESWGADLRLTNNTAWSKRPSVTVSNSDVHIVWYDERDGNNEIYYKRSTDGGISWGADTRLTNDPSDALYPSASVSGSVVHVVWEDNRDGSYEIFYKRSTDAGVSWETDTQWTNTNVWVEYPSVTVSGSVVHVVWEDERNGNYEIYYKRSIDDGLSWETDTRLTNNTARSNRPSVTVSGSVVHVVWGDERDGNEEIYFKRSTDGGESWSLDTRLTNNTSLSRKPSVRASGSAVHVVWYDYRDGGPEIYYKRSSDAGVSWESDTRLTNNIYNSYYPSVAVSGLVVHVVWIDERDGDAEIYYKRDPIGNITGLENSDLNIPNEFSLLQNYPNPFNPSTKISWQSPVGSWQTLKVFNSLGQEVETIVNEYLEAGVHSKLYIVNSTLPSGVYFYQLRSGNYLETKKMTLLK